MEDEKQIRWVGAAYDDLVAFPKRSPEGSGHPVGEGPGHADATSNEAIKEKK
jgi:hypothetical protein